MTPTNTIKESDKLRLACIDLETNGLDLKDENLSISVRILNPDGTPTETEFYSLIRNTQPLNKEAVARNKLKQEDLDKAPFKGDVLVALKSWWIQKNYGMQFSPMGHNFLGFDKPRLELFMGEDNYRAMFHYHADDSMVIARSLQRNGMLPVDSCSLVNLAKFFEVEHVGAHNASTDTYICGMVYSKLLKILKPTFMTRLIRVVKPTYLGV